MADAPLGVPPPSETPARARPGDNGTQDSGGPHFRIDVSPIRNVDTTMQQSPLNYS
jgi:hypothetical protein